MDKLVFSVAGSKGDVYAVTFERNGANLNAFCTCEAGSHGLYCKHRFSLMDGVCDALSSDNAGDIEKLKEMMVGTDVEAAYLAVIEAEKNYEAAKSALAKTKKVLAAAMYR